MNFYVLPQPGLLPKEKEPRAPRLWQNSGGIGRNRDLTLGQSGQLRNNTVRFYVTAARDLLLGVNKGNEHALGDYGFTVDTSPSPAAVAKKAAKAAAKSQPAK